ncbi:MAG TPA: hypothetical protein VIR59_04630 [Gaiellaceae bacterium]
MKTSHTLAVAAMLAVASIFGFLAATKTAGLRSAKATSASAAVTARAHRLDRIEASLHRALRQKPPALPPLPAPRAAVVTPAPQVVYRRPAPVVVVKHRPNSESEHEQGGESGD